MIYSNEYNPKFIYIDLFCGAGGTTTGLVKAIDKLGRKICIVAAAVNHDKNAIKSHWSNHPEVEHFEEDIRTLELTRLIRLVNMYRAFYPDAKIVLWASLECTNFSRAKGGRARNADSRTLAEHLLRYIDALEPDYIKIENVVEFMEWGALGKKGQPLKKTKGVSFRRWCREINRQFGYRNEWREMNSADYGAHTMRNRLFGCFAKGDLPITWPPVTHARNPKATGLAPWLPVRDVLNLDDEGESVFNRKKTLATATMKRLYEGTVKIVGAGDSQFISKYHGNGFNVPLTASSPTVATKDQLALVSAKRAPHYFIYRPFTNGGSCQSVDSAVGALLSNPKMYKVQINHAIYNPGWGGHFTTVNVPCVVVVARQDKAPLYMVTYKSGKMQIPIYDTDCEWAVKLKQFMAEHDIEDIKMRMLRIIELKRIQGFPDSYVLVGTMTEQKKYIGNSVHPKVPKRWAESMQEVLN